MIVPNAGHVLSASALHIAKYGQRVVHSTCHELLDQLVTNQLDTPAVAQEEPRVEVKQEPVEEKTDLDLDPDRLPVPLNPRPPAQKRSHRGICPVSSINDTLKHVARGDWYATPEQHAQLSINPNGTKN